MEGTKFCTKCNETKSRAEFWNERENKDGLQRWCKTCMGASHKAWYKSNAARSKAMARQWIIDHPVQAKLNSSKKRKTNPVVRFNRELRRVGLTPEQYEAVLARQGGRCAICGTDKPGRGTRLHLDHCHKTGRFRALLCANCNTGLGQFDDDPMLLQKAIAYLAFHHQPKVEENALVDSMRATNV